MNVDVPDWRFAREVLEGGLLSVIMPVYRLADSIEANLAFVADCLAAGGIPFLSFPSGLNLIISKRAAACQSLPFSFF